ncbi:MerR family transcriptional regulator [Nocardia sp. NBC_00565]|uniref:MerR family transcriptional regulator n=1 Tax=Nocardia sp. NBC_00565 TaxID=2975993 RepID=UPI002E80344D|nr:MerR family transcriptional regulator [Nocardia sp. NBC_00565]WUC04101.1 MerR family transcriptional regulator [Nocardia sp. NBC_00565]
MTERTIRSLVGIGELSRSTGVPVRTIRFYCDNGILESRRSSGGHRMFDPAAGDRLLLVRRMRALGLSLPAIVSVLDGTESIGTAVAVERAALDAELDELRWRRASLLALEHASPTERAARLELLAAVQNRNAILDTLVTFWRRVLTPMPPELFDAFIDMHIPHVPTEPTPHQVVAYAELTGLAADPNVKTAMTQQIWRAGHSRIRDRRGLLTAVADSYSAAALLVAANEKPCPGVELDAYVVAHATTRGEPDTLRFRRRLLRAAADTDPRLHRYWALTAEITGTHATVGAVHYWLLDALRVDISM